MEKDYPSIKVFVLMMLSPALGGYGIGFISLVDDVLSGYKDFISLLIASLFFSICGFLFYALPMIIFCGIVVRFRFYAKMSIYFLLSFVGGGVALIWPLLLFNKGFGGYDKYFFINSLFFLIGFISIFIMSFVSLPKK